MLLTDGPFIDSKEFLAGVILIDAGDLDEALAIASELTEVRPGRVVAIEVRPVILHQRGPDAPDCPLVMAVNGRSAPKWA